MVAAVAYPTKILFWKRITAICLRVDKPWWLLLILQRYYFESESQPGLQWDGVKRGCCLSYKDTILKANHSCAHTVRFRRLLLLILQRYYFESESQPLHILLRKRGSCCLSYKDTILKANHSHNQNPPSFLVLLLILQRYYFESESQLIFDCGSIFEAVAYPTKILFWKRITAISFATSEKGLLLLILQRYYFESESQLKIACNKIKFRCCLSYKDTILKANHSFLARLPSGA